MAVAAPLTVHAAPNTEAHGFQTAPTGRVDAKLAPAALSKAPVKVIVELNDAPVTVVEAKEKRKLDADQKRAVREQLKQRQQGVVDKAKQVGGTVLANMQDAYNGVKVKVAGTEIAALSKAPGVKAVHAVEVHHLDNAVSVPYMGVPQVWQDTGFTGKGVKLAVIDSGIDYTHADFGGPGTVEAYTLAKASEGKDADPALFGPKAPRIKGGWDFVGNDYDATAAGATPKPDPNPLDCGGHGSHVAGTAGGSGVLADGKTYAGPYDASTPKQSWKIGPGVAPEAELYAYKVFGCKGSTDVTTEAIDRAVADGADVINMSLGSSYGTATDTSAVAASNAVGAGVVVVASAGNAGPNPYLTGSPGAGRGVISVAANDPTGSFPGAKVTFADGSTLSAINANGLDPLPAGPFTVVVLKDDPATPENEAQGCSVAANTKNGIKPGANQIAVSVRGECGRAARPVYAQQAGAAAAAMIDTSANHPPYEGPITANVDTQEPFKVTIPFLGFRGVLGSAPTDDGDKLVAANGQQLTFAADKLPNPTFTELSSFSSGGPRTGDSGLKANVTAPGVSTVSAAVGAGSGSSVKSGTSMAAPHVAGAAALTVQAHPGWSAQDRSAALVNTADPGKVGNYRLTLGGSGLVDTAESVKTQVTAVSDSFTTEKGLFRSPTMSFGFAEGTDKYIGNKSITLTNHGQTPVTYTAWNESTPQSRPASLTLSTKSVTVPAGGTAEVDVKLVVKMGSVGSVLGTDEFAFYEASGNVVFKGAGAELRVPWLMVPRAQANVEASFKDDPFQQTHANGMPGNSTLRMELTNVKGAIGTKAEFFQLGLVDAQNDVGQPGHPGTDLRALGVQSVDLDGGDKLLVFAMNSFDRYSNAARNQSQVLIDKDNDGKPEFLVFAVDSGLIRSKDPDGRNEVYIQDLAKKTTVAAGYMAVSPTDNSTTLLPVKASSLGITKATGMFSYTGKISSIASSAASDSFDGTARYNAWAPAIENAQSVEVNKGAKRVPVQAKVDPAAFAAQKPQGVMVVVLDNHSGENEAILLRRS